MSCDAFCFHCKTAHSIYDFEQKHWTTKYATNNEDLKCLKCKKPVFVNWSHEEGKDEPKRGYDIYFKKKTKGGDQELNDHYPIRRMGRKKLSESEREKLRFMDMSEIFSKQISILADTKESDSILQHMKELGRNRFSYISENMNSPLDKFFDNSQDNTMLRHSVDGKHDYISIIKNIYDDQQKAITKKPINMKDFKEKISKNILGLKKELSSMLSISVDSSTDEPDSDFFDLLVDYINESRDITHDGLNDIMCFPGVLVPNGINIIIFKLYENRSEFVCNKNFYLCDKKRSKTVFISLIKDEKFPMMYDHLVLYKGGTSKDKIKKAGKQISFDYGDNDARVMKNILILRQNCSKVLNPGFFNYYKKNNLNITRRPFSKSIMNEQMTIEDWVKKSNLTVISQNRSSSNIITSIYVKEKRESRETEQIYLIPMKYIYVPIEGYPIKNIYDDTEDIENQSRLPTYVEAVDFYKKHKKIIPQIKSVITDTKKTEFKGIILDTGDVLKLTPTKYSKDEVHKNVSHSLMPVNLKQNKSKDLSKDSKDSVKYRESYSEFWIRYEEFLANMSDEFRNGKQTDILKFIDEYSDSAKGQDVELYNLLKEEMTYNKGTIRLLTKSQVPKFLIEKMLHENNKKPNFSIIDTAQKFKLIESNMLKNEVKNRLKTLRPESTFINDESGLKLPMSIQNILHLDFRYFKPKSKLICEYNSDQSESTLTQLFKKEYDSTTFIREIRDILGKVNEVNVVVFNVSGKIDSEFTDLKNKTVMFYNKNGFPFPVKLQGIYISSENLSNELIYRVFGIPKTKSNDADDADDSDDSDDSSDEEGDFSILEDTNLNSLDQEKKNRKETQVGQYCEFSPGNLTRQRSRCKKTTDEKKNSERCKIVKDAANPGEFKCHVKPKK